MRQQTTEPGLSFDLGEATGIGSSDDHNSVMTFSRCQETSGVVLPHSGDEMCDLNSSDLHQLLEHRDELLLAETLKRGRRSLNPLSFKGLAQLRLLQF